MALPYTEEDGSPKCSQPEKFNAQKDRVQIITVLKGSIVVHFWIKANQTKDEVTAAIAMDNLKWQLRNPKSPIRRDEEFGRFAEWATVEEKLLSSSYQEKNKEVLDFEKVRGKYTDKT